MNVRNLYLLLAREVETEQADGMTSITKIIEKFNATVDPDELEKRELTPGEAPIVVSAHYAVATSWLFDAKLKKDTLVTTKIGLIDPSGHQLEGPEQEHLVPKGTNRVNLNFDMQGLLVTASGEYVLRAELYAQSKRLLGSAEYPYMVEINWRTTPDTAAHQP